MSESTVHTLGSQIRVLDENHESFAELVELAAVCSDERRLELGAVLAEIAAYRATWRHGGLYVSYELEKVLWSLAEQGLPQCLPAREAGEAMFGIERVLHVTSLIIEMAGLQHLVRRWIELDADRRHSVAVSQPGWRIIPDELASLVATSGGQIELVGDDHDTIMARAQRIRELAVGHDLVVLHLQTEDVAPVLALCQPSGLPPVVLVNHADHAFWLGATVIDRVVNLRRAGLLHCQNRRAIEPDRLALLPTPLPPDLADRMSRSEARAELGLDPETVMLLTVARGRKYRSNGDVSYPMTHVELLRQHPQCRLLAVGPDHDDEWEQASRLTGGRITAMGQRSDTDVFFRAADIYVDAYPMVSITSLLEAGGLGVPLVSRCEYPPESAIWCADAPGLDDHLVRCRDLDAYIEALARLVEDPDHRVELGRATRDSILRAHVGSNWVESLEHLYSSMDNARDDDRDRFPSSPRNLSQPDLLMPELLRGESGLRFLFTVHGAQLAVDRGTIRILARRPKLLVQFLVSRIELILRQLGRPFRRIARAPFELVRRFGS